MKHRILSVLAVFAVAFAARARADIKDFTNYCTVQAFNTCASVQVETVPDGNGGTVVVMRVRNLQGTLSADQTGGSMLTKLGLTAPTIAGAANLSVGT